MLGITIEGAGMFQNPAATKSLMTFIENDDDTDSTEHFIPDHRAGLRPSEIVQSKFMTLVPDMPIPVSCLHTMRDTRRAFPASKG